ncbi:MAG: hypothetical protein IKC83_00845 [Clostridia bacterium]|nr:hypothetical protein [Clostridia bacterium]
MKKTAKILIICLLFVAIFVSGAISFASRYDDVRTLFISSGSADVSVDGGAKVTVREEGVGVTFRDDVSGTFTLGLSVPAVANNGLKNIRFVYTDLSDKTNTITVCVEVGNKAQTFYTLIGDEKYGIYYDKGVMAGKTLSQNAIGNYTELSGSNDFSVSFNPSTMKVVASGKLVWDYSTVTVDGAYTGVTKEGFEKYSLSVFVDEISYGTAQFIVKSINGTTLNGQYLTEDNDKPSIFADVKTNALTDTEYSVPRPVVYDLCDGNISATDVDVKVVSPKGKTIFDAKWTQGSYFETEDEGEYTISYSVLDVMGNKGSISFTVKAFKEIQQNRITYDNNVREGEFGAGATHLIPKATVQNDMFIFNKEIVPYVEISRNGVVLYERWAKENFKYTFGSAGEYTVKYYVKEKGYKIYSETYTVSVKEGMPAISYVDISSEYLFGGIVDIPDAEVILGQKSAKADVLVVTPSGRYIADRVVRLDEIGKYVIEYSAEIDEKQYIVKESFNSIYAPEDIFTESAGLSASFSSNPFESKINGLLVTSGAEVEATINSVVKMNELTKDDLLIGLQAIPKQVGEVEYNKFYVTLTDTEDPANYIRIFIYGNNENYLSYARVSFNGSKELGWRLNYDGTGGNISSSKTGGLILRHSFKGLFEQGHDLSDGAIKIYFDWEEKAFYAGDVYHQFTSGVKLLADLDDPEWVSAFGKEWKGFTNNTAYLTVSYGYREKREINWYDLGSYYSSAQYLITGAVGMDFTTMTTKDTVAPTIFVDNPTKVSNAVLNEKYKVFDAIAIDNMTEEVDLDVNVVLNYGANNYLDVEIKDGYFVPIYNGTYNIIYTAKDDFGNVTRATIPVTTIESASPISATASLVGSYSAGIEGVLPDLTVSGGVGNYTTEVELTSQSGRVYAVADDLSFFPEESGAYTAVYTVKDYIGMEKTVTVNFNVATNFSPVFDQTPIMPVVMTAGVAVDIPEITATDYGADEPTKVNAQVKVKYPGESEYHAVGKSFIPDGEKITASGDELVFRYEAIGEKGLNFAEFNVPVAKMNMITGNIDPSEYFVKSSDAVDVSMNKDDKGRTRGVKITPNAQGDYVIFGKKVLAKGLSVDFTINELDDNNHLKRLEFIVYDSVDSNIAIKYTLFRNYTNNYFVMIAGNTLRPTATLDKFSGNFSFNVDTNIGKLAGGSGKAIKCVNGDDFNGFPSGYVFIKVVVSEFKGAKENGFVVINGIGIQNLNDTGKDNVAPSIHVLGGYGGGAVVGEEYLIPRALAGDILSTWQDVTVTVKGPSGSAVTAFDGTLLSNAVANKDYKISLSSAGNYTIQYQVKDSNGNSPLSPPVNLLVKTSAERVPVTLSFSGVVPEKGTAGKEVTLPTAAVVGSNGAGQYVLITVFNAERKAVAVKNNTFIPEKSGKYSIVYFGYDSNGNAVSESFDLTVSK